MLRIIFREILILVGCLSIFPAVLILVLVQSDSPEASMKLLARGLLTSQVVGPAGSLFVLGIRVAAPYLIVQAIRAYFWSGKSLFARKWAYLYFSTLLAAVGVWSFWRAWDLFYFMYALGDIPAEIRQFIDLEGRNLVVFVFCAILGVHCFRVFLNPANGSSRSPEQSSSAR